MKFKTKKNVMFVKVSSLICLLSVAGCGGGGGDNVPPTNSFRLTGSVPGTLIEAFGENGSYYQSVSTDNGTDRHPFSITLKQGVVYYLFMTVNENTPQSITTPIKFSANNYRFTFNKDTAIDLGYIPLYKTRDDAGGFDADDDGVLDSHHQIADKGLISLANPTASTTWDSDNDGIHNKYDYDFVKSSDDNDGDGIPNSIDINPNNNDKDDNRFDLHLDRDNDGYLDEDRDRDGYYDDDHNRDGYHDDDHNRDGYHDDDHDKDGYHDDDDDHDGISDDDGSYSEVEGIITAINSTLITMNVTKKEHAPIPLGSLVVDTTKAYFEHTRLASLSVGHYIEVKGVYNATTHQLVAYKVERE